MGSATWRRRIVSQLSCQTRQVMFPGLNSHSQVGLGKQGVNHRITAKRFSATSFAGREARAAFNIKHQ
jgi:hypothetical protein